MQVAHYLILTHLSEQGDAMPMMDITNMRKRARPGEEDQLMDNPVFKQARMAYDVSQDARQRAGCAPAFLQRMGISNMLDLSWLLGAYSCLDSLHVCFNCQLFL